MIVRNESACIARCLNSVLPYVKSAVILDTGSTDDTKLLIAAMCEQAGVPHRILEGPFENFGKARNDAFAAARRLRKDPDMPFTQFALLVDADMELDVTDPKAFDNLDANALSYDMMQQGGAVSYANRRLANLYRLPDDPYVGVTHEYFNAPSAGTITGARFIDHADGANREKKFVRDCQLLEEALKTEPDNGRYWYYLGNSYKDWGATDPTVLPYAIDAYKKRIELGGWDEETHSAMMHLAHCYKDDGLPDMFVATMVTAYGFRPRSAEPLYELAKFYRETKGQPAAALMFAKAGMKMKRPDDLLFVNEFVYSHGLRFEYSVAGYYDEEERSRAFEVTDDLALDPEFLPDHREAARRNLYWFLKPLSEYCPSFKGKKIDFTPPHGYQAMNPSVTQHHGNLVCNIRCVNYRIDGQGRYMIGPKECGDAPIETRNFLLNLDEDLAPTATCEVFWSRPSPAWNMVIGLEDIRLNSISGTLCFSATVREQLASGECQMWWGTLSYDPAVENAVYAVGYRPISDGTTTEKNWAPLQGSDKFMYKPGTVVRPIVTVKEDAKLTVTVNPSKVHVEHLRGSSQLIPFKNGWLTVVHEASVDGAGKRTYWHRFVWYDQDGAVQRISLPFVFYDRQIEFCAGMAYHPNGVDLVLSFGVRDYEAHIATVDAVEVSRMIWKWL
jgi:glycosyltransferase involved in cell wall biosynthesis